MWQIPTVSQLSSFVGQPLEQFSPFAPQALAQATFLFSMVTELVEPPTDPNDNELAYNGILSMADHLYLSQPFREIQAAPIQDGQMGSGRFSKPVNYIRGTAAANALRGEETGIMWFDLAVQTLALRTRRGGVFWGGVSLLERVDECNLVTDQNGRAFILGPSDQDNHGGFFDVNADSWPGGEGINPSM